MAEFHCVVGKNYVWKELGFITRGRWEVEVGTLLLSNDENNVIAENEMY